MVMKSLLVDALRATNEAGEAGTASETDDSAPASNPAAAEALTGAEYVPAPAELELLEPGETVGVDAHDHVSAVDGDTEFAASIVLPTDAGFGSANDSLKTRVLELAASSGSGDAATFERLAVWTPFVCLLLAVGSFAAFSAWSHMVGAEHSSELSMGLKRDYSPGVRAVDYVDRGQARRFAFTDSAVSLGRDSE